MFHFGGQVQELDRGEHLEGHKEDALGRGRGCGGRRGQVGMIV